MAYHPLNLGLRFVLEMVALVIFGMWGWSAGGWRGWVLAALAVIVAAAVWGAFRTPGGQYADEKASLVAVPGPVRLGIEIIFFGLAVIGLIMLGHPVMAAIFGLIVIIHYTFSWDRNAWLIRTR